MGKYLGSDEIDERIKKLGLTLSNSFKDLMVAWLADPPTS